MLTKPQEYKHILPDLQDWPIYNLHQDRERFVEEIIRLTEERLEEKFGSDRAGLIAKTLYMERNRVREEPWKADPANEDNYWRHIKTVLKRSSQQNGISQTEREREIIHNIVNRYAEEIVGGFRIKTFLFARRFLNLFFNRLLNAAAGRLQKRIWGREHQLSERLRVYGSVQKMRKLFEKSTVVIVPTHSSNLDSILIGFAIDRIVGLPGFIYGAGLNLYDSEFFSYFMNRLGAYRVDRRKKNPIYLESLKSMSAIALQRGVNSIFFPGGTRSRSGVIEQRLKLGLMGTAIEAQRTLYAQGSDQKIIIVPLVLNYHCVLEADYLIDQHLKRTGKEKYFRSKDDFKKLRNILRFLWRLFDAKSDILLNFAEPMDVFGNTLDDDGNSLKNGKIIDIKEYFMGDNDVERNVQREQIYTRLLSEHIAQSYKANNIVLSSQLVAFAAYRYFVANNSGLDLYDLISLPTDEFVFDEADLVDYIARIQKKLLKLENDKKIILGNNAQLDPKEVLELGMAKLGVFHPLKPLMRNKDGTIVSESFKLLLFYHNRLTGYGLESGFRKLKVKKNTNT